MTVPFTVYDSSTGEILRSGRCLVIDFERQAKAGQAVLPIASDDTIHAVDIPWDGSPPSLVSRVIVPPSLEELKAAAKARAAERRWEIESGGIDFGGGRMATDDRSKLLLASAAEQSRADSEFSAKWKMGDGQWVEVNAAQLIAAYSAVFAHVRSCFAREEELDGLISAAEDAETLADLVADLADFWP